MTPRIGLIGDHDPTVPAHRAIPLALRLAGEALGVPVAFEWVPTTEISHAARVAGFDGLWCVPASPYRSVDGALLAIRFAREHGRPFLGTCGGFQHAVIEYARNVLGWADAEHAETAPDAPRAVIAPLACALVEATDAVSFRAGSRIATAYGCDRAVEGYHCRYGLNPEFQATLVSGALRTTAHDAAGEVRAIELDGHPFFVATLFQPERAALQGQLPPLAAAFVRAAAAHAARRPAVAAPSVTVRPARESDLADIENMVNDFVKGHPAERHPRSRAALRDAFFGASPLAKLLVAVRADRIVGMGQWVPIYDMFWGMFGANAEWLYVRPEHRGSGIVAAIVAEICKQVRAAGGEFLHGGGGDGPERLYERVAIGFRSSDCYLSAEAFQVFADLAGLPPREIVRKVPSPELNRVPARARGDGPAVEAR